MFQGYDYDEVDEVNMGLINPFIDHIKNIICSKNNEIYRYVINWVAFLFQNIKTKNRTVLVLTGAQRTGKNTFTNVLCNLLGNYANENANLENIMGTFNSSILYKKLIVCNEVKSFLSYKNFDSGILKQLITEDTIDIHQKFHDVVHMENVSNFIFLSNEFAPVKIDEDDGRYFVIEVSGEKKGDTEYFDTLYSKFTPEFYSNLLTFFKKIDLRNWDRTKIPMTEVKKAIIEFSKSPYSSFIQDHIQKFVTGFIKSECFDAYRTWCKEKDIAKTGTMQDFRINMLKYCQDYRPRTTGAKRPYYYLLKKESYVYFKLNPNDDDDSN